MTNPRHRFHLEDSGIERLCRVFAKACGVMFLVFGLGWLGREIRFGWKAQPASGTIVEVKSRMSADGPEFYPVVEFTTATGRGVRFEGLSTSPPPVAGTPVEVLYDPDRPERARINSLVQRWLLGALFTPIGGVILVVASIGRRKSTGSPTAA
jgi:hypothetical protein